MRRFTLVGCLLLGACSFEVEAVQPGSTLPDGGGFDGTIVVEPDLLAPPDAPVELSDEGPVEEPDLATVDLSSPDLVTVDLAPPPDLTTLDLTTVDQTPVTGQLSVTRDTFNGSINLTNEGTTDWAHWGLNGVTVDHKKVGASAVGDIVGASVETMATQYSSFIGVSFSWTDGTPVATSNGTSSGILISGVGHRFEVTAPADTTTRVLAVYLSYYNAVPSFRAELSDGSATVFNDSPVTSAANMGGYFKYTVTYRAASAGQKITVRWSVVSEPGTPPSISLLAATLR